MSVKKSNNALHRAGARVFRWVRSAAKWRWPVWLVFAVVFAAFFAISLKKLDPDFGWHLAQGRYFMAHWIPAHDIYTYTATSYPWVPHEWLSDIMLAIVYDFGGWWLLAAVYAALWTLAIFILTRLARTRVWTPLIFFAVLAILPFAGIRTAVWAVLGLAILLWIIRKKSRYWMILPLTLIWANVHGSFLIIFFILGYEVVFQRKLQLILWGVLAFGVTFINPAGAGLYRETLATVTDMSLKTRITEWAINFPSELFGFMVLFGVGLAVSWKKMKWRDRLALENFLFLMGVSSQRNWPVFVAAALAPTGERLRELRAKIKITDIKKQFRNFPKTAKWVKLGAVVLGFGAVVYVGFTLYNNYAGAYQAVNDRGPARVAAALNSGACGDGHLFNRYDVGGYLIWKAPKVKVYIDGRMPSWQKNGRDVWMDEYLKVLDPTTGEWKNEFKKWNITCAALPSGSDLAKTLSENGWTTPITHDNGYDLLAKKGVGNH